MLGQCSKSFAYRLALLAISVENSKCSAPLPNTEQPVLRTLQNLSQISLLLSLGSVCARFWGNISVSFSKVSASIIPFCSLQSAASTPIALDPSIAGCQDNLLRIDFFSIISLSRNTPKNVTLAV